MGHGTSTPLLSSLPPSCTLGRRQAAWPWWPAPTPTSSLSGATGRWPCLRATGSTRSASTWAGPRCGSTASSMKSDTSTSVRSTGLARAVTTSLWIITAFAERVSMATLCGATTRTTSSASASSPWRRPRRPSCWSSAARPTARRCASLRMTGRPGFSRSSSSTSTRGTRHTRRPDASWCSTTWDTRASSGRASTQSIGSSDSRWKQPMNCRGRTQTSAGTVSTSSLQVSNARIGS
mmetsp:Transcript_51732/g.150210  ORF Transcript_51732/g.150210 Transcript_51732/m.150210 type:complete len:236 (+) Transcript_51732:276-983(+)